MSLREARNRRAGVINKMQVRAREHAKRPCRAAWAPTDTARAAPDGAAGDGGGGGRRPARPPQWRLQRVSQRVLGVSVCSGCRGVAIAGVTADGRFWLWRLAAPLDAPTPPPVLQLAEGGGGRRRRAPTRRTPRGWRGCRGCASTPTAAARCRRRRRSLTSVPSASSLRSMAASLGSLPSSTYAQSTFGGFDGGRLEAPGDLLFDPTAARTY